MVLEKTLESPLDCKEIQPVHPKGDQSWVFIGRTDAEAETPILWPPHAKNWLIGKDPDAGSDWRRRRRGWQRMRWLNGITTWWTWVWVNSGGLWLTGRPGVLRFMGSQRVRHDWMTELNWKTSKSLPGSYIIPLKQKEFKTCLSLLHDGKSISSKEWAQRVRNLQGYIHKAKVTFFSEQIRGSFCL